MWLIEVLAPQMLLRPVVWFLWCGLVAVAVRRQFVVRGACRDDLTFRWGHAV